MRSSVLDRLERAGYVQRLVDPSDRRRVLVQTTERFASSPSTPGSCGCRMACFRFTPEQLDGIRKFLRGGAELSYRRAEEITEEVRSR